LNSPSLSIVIPALNEKDNIFPLLNRLEQVLGKLPFLTEIIFVDDGSTDGTTEEVMRAHADDARVGLIKFSRNFGHEAAMLAGLDNARGNAVVVMDADLQHPPEIILQLVSKWQAGADIVQTIRKTQASGIFLKSAISCAWRGLAKGRTRAPTLAWRRIGRISWSGTSQSWGAS
jgi:dolichol-phosphate mannosyltransferase